MAEDNKTGSFMWDLNADFKKRLQELIKASNGRVSLVSGYRSPEQQQRLYDAAVAKYGEANAGRWAAVPGKSNHEKGFAGDIAFSTDAAKEWAHKNAARFGLEFPMEWEPWHIEPTGTRTGVFDKNYTPDRQAYTFFEGKAHPQDVSDRFGSLSSVLQGALSYPGAFNDPSLGEETITEQGVIDNAGRDQSQPVSGATDTGTVPGSS